MAALRLPTQNAKLSLSQEIPHPGSETGDTWTNWDNSTATADGWQKLSGLATAPPGTDYVRLEVVASQLDGYAFFDDVTLDELVPGSTITRSTYGLAGPSPFK